MTRPMWTYLDNNATTQPAPEVVAAVREVHEQLWANPSSVHRFGQMARQRVELARSAVAKLIGCRERELIFTSGGTESNNLALAGVLGSAGGNPVLITTRIEHSAIREPAAWHGEHGVTVVFLPVDRRGRIDPSSLAPALDAHAVERATVLVSVQWANNETGVIQPIADLGRVIGDWRGRTRRAVFFHSDATQAVGKIPVDVKAAGVDLLTLSAHKFHGPKGVGALFIRTGVKLTPQQRGGPQERDRRGGTENTPGIVGMGVAAEQAQRFLADTEAISRFRGLRDRFERAVVEALPTTVINSGDAERLWNTSNLGFPRLEAEAILIGLSEQGVCASAGAACSSGSLEPSPVLLAMGIPETVAHGSLRFSLSRFTTTDEIDRAVEAVVRVIARLSKTLPVSADG